MILRKLFRMKLAFIAMILFFGTMVLSEVAEAAYPAGPTFTYGCMALRGWRVYDDVNTNLYNTTVSACTQRSTPPTAIPLEVGRTYRVEIDGLCYGGTSCYYGNYLGLWLDWNGDTDFSDAGENIYLGYTSTGYGTNTRYFTVPQTAEGNTFRFRAVGRWYAYGAPAVTGSLSGYGDFGDIQFTVPKPPADAGATLISQPVGAITSGTQNVAVRIKNFAQKPLKSCRIVWRIDEGQMTEVSRTYTWTGSLDQNVELDVVVGTFDFTQYRQYSIDAFTEYPNQDVDVNPANDRCITNYVAPALSPTNYYIGPYAGSSNTFTTIAQATNYLSQAGIIGNGTLTFIFPVEDPGPALYDGPISVGSYPSIGTNTVAFKSESGNPEDVIINFDPDGGTPYLMTLNTVSNTTIEGLTFNTSSDMFGYGGIIDLQACQNVEIKNNIFNNVSGASWGSDYTSLNISSGYDFNIHDNVFNDGAIGINESAMCPRKIHIQHNEFNNISYIFLQLYGTPSGSPCDENDVMINDTNKFFSNGAPYGIRSTNGTEINGGNIFDGFYGADGDASAVIYLENTDPANFTNQTMVQNNSMTGGMVDINGIFAQNVPDLLIENNNISIDGDMGGNNANGIKLIGTGNSTTPAYLMNNYIEVNPSANDNGLYCDNSYIMVNRCDIDLTGANGSVYSVYLTNTSGYMANSQIGASGGYAMFLENSGMGIYYNAIVNSSATLPALMVNGGSNTIRRNLVQNQLSAPAFVAGAAGGNTIDENNYFSYGTVLGIWDGIGCNDLATWQATNGQDLNSTNIEIDFIDFAQFNLGLNTYDEALVFDAPIDFGDPILNAFIQQTDYNNNIRYSYFMGSDNIIPEVFITTQPKGVMDCLGATGHFLGVSGYVTRGVQSKYEWFKDGVSLTTYYLNPMTDDWAQKASLYLSNLPFGGGAGLTYEMEGEYQCIIRGSGAEPKYTNHVLVNVLHPAEITRQPEDQRANLGDDVILEVEAHIVADSAVDDPFFQPDIQWYHGSPAVPIENDLSVDGHYSGAKSTILSIRNLSTDEIGDDYYVVLQGACETLTSDNVGVSLFPEANITEQPAPVDVCEGGIASFSIEASSPDAEATLEYQWRKDKVNIPNATAATFEIAAVTAGDVGSYDCVITVLPGGKTLESDGANLDIKLAPAITTQPATQTIAGGSPLTLTVVATGETPLTYQWYLEAAIISGATNATYTVASATLSDQGSYTCVVTNECGNVTSDAAVVTVNVGGMTDVSDLSNGGFQLTGNTPNPFAETSKLNFYAPRATFVRLAITNVFGQEVALLANNNVSAGNHEVEVNASDLKLNSGVYYYTLTSNNYSITRKMIVVR